MVVDLVALRFGDLYESQAFDGLDVMNGDISYRLCFTIWDALYNMFELAKRNLGMDHASFVIRSHLCKELLRFQLEHVRVICTVAPCWD